jgi:hypothetical protein
MALHDADLNSYRHTKRKNRKTEVLTLTRMLVYAALSTNLGSNLHGHIGKTPKHTKKGRTWKSIHLLHLTPNHNVSV